MMQRAAIVVARPKKEAGSIGQSAQLPTNQTIYKRKKDG